MHFSLATANIDVFENLAEVFNPWTAVPEVASAALQAELKEEINISDPKAANDRRKTFSSILSISPSSSIALAVVIRPARGHAPANGAGHGES